MNKSSFFGLIIVGVVLYLGVFHSAKTPGIFLDPHAFILVIGGTFAAAFVAFPYATLSRTIDYLLWGLLFKKRKEYLQVSQDIASARNSFLQKQNFSGSDESHPFFRESIMFLMNPNIDDEGFQEILINRSEYFKKKYKEDAKVLNALGKYPPAFGLLGASTGMIEMMQNLGAGGSAGIGQAMAVALVATFWGIALANFVILPLADSASKSSDEDAILRNIIIDGMIMIRENVNDDHFQAYLRGYLSLSDRTEFKVYSMKNVYLFPKASKESSDKSNNASQKAETKMQSGQGEDTVAVVKQPANSSNENINKNDPNAVDIDFKDGRGLMQKKAPKVKKI